MTSLAAPCRPLDARGSLPAAAQIDSVRRRVMIASHIFLLIPVAAVFIARAIGRV